MLLRVGLAQLQQLHFAACHQDGYQQLLVRSNALARLVDSVDVALWKIISTHRAANGLPWPSRHGRAGPSTTRLGVTQDGAQPKKPNAQKSQHARQSAPLTRLTRKNTRPTAHACEKALQRLALATTIEVGLAR